MLWFFPARMIIIIEVFNEQISDDDDDDSVIILSISISISISSL